MTKHDLLSLVAAYGDASAEHAELASAYAQTRSAFDRDNWRSAGDRRQAAWDAVESAIASFQKDR